LKALVRRRELVEVIVGGVVEGSIVAVTSRDAAAKVWGGGRKNCNKKMNQI